VKKLRILVACLVILTQSTVIWAWPPGLRASTEWFHGSSGEPRLQIASFGDSIASGFNSSFWLTKVKGGTYADHLGKWYSGEYNRSVVVRDLAWAGFTLGQILGAIRKDHTSKMKTADYIFLEGGGNDFLDLYSEKYIDLCKPENFYPTLDNAKNDFLSIINDADKYKKNSAKVRVLGIYYPLVHETRLRKCVLRDSTAPSVHHAFLNAMSKFNWFLAKEARKRGYVYVDNFAHLNCEKKDWAKCKLTSSMSEAEYTAKVYDLDETNTLKDPGDLGWLQKDRVHPNTSGHDLIGWVIRNSN
jgi:lysophospholipase L1-like esterase